MPTALKGGSKTLPKKEEKLQEPKDYRVILLNDNYTTQEFVVDVLMCIFHLAPKEAAHIMMKVHRQGRGAVGKYSWDIAQTKANQVHTMARDNDFPLRCTVEEI